MRRRCFRHILDAQKLHSVDALLMHGSDPLHVKYHRQHAQSVNDYSNGLKSFVQAQRNGTKPDLTQQRVHVAEQYRTCKPINSNFVNAGWYDDQVQTITDTDNNIELSDDSQSTSPSTTSYSSISNAPTEMSYSSKRKRVVMDFVAVPDAAWYHKRKKHSDLVEVVNQQEPSQTTVSLKVNLTPASSSSSPYVSQISGSSADEKQRISLSSVKPSKQVLNKSGPSIANHKNTSSHKGSLLTKIQARAGSPAGVSDVARALNRAINGNNALDVIER
ncbi:hypothetical protein H0H93_011676 [Arthromyces matolae]|nr:hypothetical protein H0H93_011676 [Arthromyces matolae]